MKLFCKVFFVLFLFAISFNGFSQQLNVTIPNGDSMKLCIGHYEIIYAEPTGGQYPYHYQWSPSLWLSDDTTWQAGCIPPNSFPHDTSFSYTVVVTDNLGAQANASINVSFIKPTVYDSIYVTSTAQNFTICNGMSTIITVHGDSGNAYTWFSSDMSQHTGNTVVMSPSSTIYTTVTSDNYAVCNYSQTTFMITVNNCPYNILNGTVFNDLNANSFREPGENNMLHSMVNITPADSVFSYIFDTTYTAYIGQGNFNVTQNNVPYYTQTTNPNVFFSGYTGTNTLDVGLHGMPNVTDLKVDITPISQYYCTHDCGTAYWWGPPYIYGTPGGIGSYTIHYINAGTDTLNGIIKIEFDSLFDYIGTYNLFVNNDTVLSMIGDTLIWQYHDLLPTEDRYFNMGGFDTNAVIGQYFRVIATGYPIINDTVPTNNYDTINQVYTGSWDPNFKEVEPNTDLSIHQVITGTPLTYTVHFQNTGNDTAIVVKVRDTISPKLKMSTFKMISASHPYSLSISNGNDIEWKFNNIMLPDSGANQILSNGYVKYMITPYSNLNVGDSITNNAAIYFDNNAPVITNTVVSNIVLLTSTVETEESINFHLYPNPVTGLLTIETPLKSIVEIHNITGQLIKTHATSDIKTEIDVSALPAGVYLVKIRTEKGVKVKKFVKE